MRIARFKFFRDQSDHIQSVQVLPPRVRRDCKHVWRRRAASDVSRGWKNVCKLCGASGR